MSLKTEILKIMCRIRRFEQNLLDLFAQGKLFGTTHTCIGQEMCAASLYSAVNTETDAAFSNHRCHGHFLAYGGPMDGLLAEIMGVEGALCGGRGGSQHIHWKRFFSNGVQGGIAPIGVGYALAQRSLGSGGITIVHLGDGTLGEGTLYEAFNLAALYKSPVLFFLENNEYAQSTATSTTIAGDIESRAAAFGIRTDRMKALDPVDLATHLNEVVAYVRRGQPFLQIVDTVRLMAHSKGDDNRPKELIDRLWKEDYLKRLLDSGERSVLNLDREAAHEIEALNDEMTKRALLGFNKDLPYPPVAQPITKAGEILCDEDEIGPRINENLNRALMELLKEPAVRLIGEDIDDPYGGAFKVSRNLSTAHRQKVISTPISEAGIVGMGIGMALGGLRPIVEIMFGDFLTLTADQLINHAAKFYGMYNGQVTVPLVVRTPVGGYRGYGPTHSQSMEALFLGVPGLTLLALNRRISCRKLFRHATLNHQGPVLLVENKVMYSKAALQKPPAGMKLAETPTQHPYGIPSLFFCPDGDINPEVTLVTYGGMSDLVEEAIQQLMLEDEIEVDYILLNQLYPLDIGPVVNSVIKTRCLVVIEEAPEGFGVADHVISSVARRLRGMPLTVQTVCALPVPIPNSRSQEAEVLPKMDRLYRTIIETIENTSRRPW